MSVFSRAWAKLKVKIENKTSWGKVELKSLMYECLDEAALEDEKAQTGEE